MNTRDEIEEMMAKHNLTYTQADDVVTRMKRLDKELKNRKRQKEYQIK